MTRDEILNMSAGREMDALVAETVIKLQVIKDPIAFYVHEGGFEMRLMPFYSTDIRAAWEILDRFYSACVEKLSNGKEYAASLHGSVDGYNTYHFATAETAPLAVCRAALLAVMK